MRVTFRSRVDRKLKAIALVMPCIALIAIITAPPLATAVLWLPISLCILVAAIVIWVVLSTYYELKDDVLVAHSGPFSWRIPLREIRAVRQSNSIRSGPALSMDRLEVAYGDGRVLLISPEDKSGFLTTLRQRAPHLAS